MDDDRAAIAALIYAYAERLDGGDLDGVADLFTQAELRSDRSDVIRRGREQALALYRDVVLLYDGIPHTKHVLTSVVIEIAGDGAQATSRCAFTVFQSRPALPLQAILAGRYCDRFSRGVAAEWHFAERLIRVDFIGDLRFHNRRPAR